MRKCGGGFAKHHARTLEDLGGIFLMREKEIDMGLIEGYKNDQLYEEEL